MKNFVKDIVTEIQQMLHGDLHLGHYITLFLGLVFLIIGIFQFKARIIDAVLTVITTLFYTLGFCVTFSNYANTTSNLVFLAVSLVLNFVIWMISARIKFKRCLKWLYGYLLILVPMALMGFLREGFGLTEDVVSQFSFLLISLILCLLTQFVENSPENNSTEGPFERLGPGWGSVFKNWP